MASIRFPPVHKHTKGFPMQLIVSFMTNARTKILVCDESRTNDKTYAGHQTLHIDIKPGESLEKLILEQLHHSLAQDHRGGSLRVTISNIFMVPTI